MDDVILVTLDTSTSDVYPFVLSIRFCEFIIDTVRNTTKQIQSKTFDIINDNHETKQHKS